MPSQTERILVRTDVEPHTVTVIDEDGVVRRGQRVRNVREKGMTLGTYCTGFESHFAYCAHAAKHRR